MQYNRRMVSVRFLNNDFPEKNKTFQTVRITATVIAKRSNLNLPFYGRCPKNTNKNKGNE